YPVEDSADSYNASRAVSINRVSVVGNGPSYKRVALVSEGWTVTRGWSSRLMVDRRVSVAVVSVVLVGKSRTSTEVVIVVAEETAGFVGSASACGVTVCVVSRASSAGVGLVALSSVAGETAVAVAVVTGSSLFGVGKYDATSLPA